MAKIISLNMTSSNDYEHETINSVTSFSGNANELVQTDAHGRIDHNFLSDKVLISRDKVLDKDLLVPPANPAVGDRYLLTEGTASLNYDQIILSNMSNASHNATYILAEYGPNKVTGLVEIEGTMVHFDTETEAERVLTVTGLNMAGIDGKQLTVIKHAGYFTSAGNRYTWHNGSVGGAHGFHWYYWSKDDKVLVAWDNTVQDWRAFNLNHGVGAGVMPFLSDLNSTGPNGGYVANGRFFDIPESFVGCVVNTSGTFPDEIAKVPDVNNSHVNYGTPRDHAYYIYQDTSKTKFIAFSEKTGYWTVFVLNAPLDLCNSSPNDNQGFSQAMFNWDILSTSSLGYGDGVKIPDDSHVNVAYPGAVSWPSGNWSTFAANDIVEYTASGWVKDSPAVISGTYVFVQDEGTGYIFNGVEFQSLAAGSLNLAQNSFLSFDSTGLKADVEASLAGASNKLVSSAAIKAYVDSQIDLVDSGATLQEVNVGGAPIQKGDLLQYIGNNVVGKHSNTVNSQAIGFAASSAPAHGVVSLQTEGIISGVLHNVNADEKIFWTTQGLSSNPDTAGGTRIRVVGVAANTTDLQLVPLQRAIING